MPHPPEHFLFPLEKQRRYFFIMVIPRLECTTEDSLERFRKSMTKLVMAFQIATPFQSDTDGSPRLLAIAIVVFTCRKQAENAVLEINEQILGTSFAGFPRIAKLKGHTESSLRSIMDSYTRASIDHEIAGICVHDKLGGIFLFKTELDARNAQYKQANNHDSLIRLEEFDYSPYLTLVEEVNLDALIKSLQETLNAGNREKANTNNVRKLDSDALIKSLQETIVQTILETKLALSAANYPLGKILLLESRLTDQFESLRESMEDLREFLADIRGDSDAEESSE